MDNMEAANEAVSMAIAEDAEVVKAGMYRLAQTLAMIAQAEQLKRIADSLEKISKPQSDFMMDWITAERDARAAKKAE